LIKHTVRVLVVDPMQTTATTTATATATATSTAEDVDPQNRLDECKSFFSSSTVIHAFQFDNEMHTNDGFAYQVELFQKVLTYLFDRWSVIRVHCARSLSTLLSGLLPPPPRPLPPFVTLLIESLHSEVQQHTRCWQELHGCLLGYTSLVDTIVTAGGLESSIQFIIETCLHIMSHVRIPIRDSAKDCLVQISRHDLYRKVIGCRILSIIDNLRVHDEYDKDRDNEIHMPCEASESETLTIDGLLGTLADMMPLLKDDISLDRLPPPSASLPSSSSWECGSSEWSLQRMSATIRHSMRHPASTVRQKAGAILSSLIKSLLAEIFSGDEIATADAVSRVYYLCDSVLMTSLRENDVEAWQGHEVCLIVCEELLREATTLFLAGCLRSRTQAVTVSSILQSLNTLVHFLQHEFGVLLIHPRFEVRRVQLQLLPTLARAQIALFSNTSTLTVDSSLLTAVVSQPPEAGVMSTLNSFQRLANSVRLSVLIKESRHVYEVLASFVNSSTLSTTNSFSVNEQWSVEVHGRLLEVELRQEFHAQCERLCCLTHAEPEHGIQLLCNIFIQSQLEIAQLLLVFFQIGEASIDITATEGHSVRFLSIDFIELLALSQCFCITIAHRLPLLLSSLSTLVQVSFSTEFTARVAVLQQRSQQLLSQLTAHLDIWLSLCLLLQTNSAAFSAAMLQTPTSVSTHNSCMNAFALPQYTLPRQSSAEIAVLLLLVKQQRLQSNDNQPWICVHCEPSGFCLSNNVVLLPSLSDPATNPALYLDSLYATPSESSPCISASNSSKSQSNRKQESFTNKDSPLMNTPQPKPHHFHHHSHDGKHSLFHHIVTPTASPARSAQHQHLSLSPSMKVFAQQQHSSSQKSPSLRSPNRVGVGCDVPLSTSSASYSSMNRWCCEAISPLLHVLVALVTCNYNQSAAMSSDRSIYGDYAVLLLTVISEWQSSVLRDPLWLDNRKFARRSLFESIGPLLPIVVAQQIEPNLANVTTVDDCTSMSLLLLNLLRTFSDSLTLECCVQQKLDLKIISPLIKCVNILLTSLQERFADTVSWKSLDDRQRELFQLCFRFPRDSLDLAKEVRDLLDNHLENLMSSNTIGHSLSICLSPSAANMAFPTTIINPTHSTSRDSAEDEFSDWDEEDSDDDSVHCTDASAAIICPVANATTIDDIKCVQSLLSNWYIDVIDEP
jgi:hypothetical protein